MKKKSLITRCTIAVLICCGVSALPVLFNHLEESGDFSYTSMDVTATVNRDGSLSMHEEFYLDASDSHTYLREIFVNKDSRSNYSSQNHGEMDLSSFSVQVDDPVSGILRATYEDQLNPNLRNPSDNIIAFNGSFNELGQPIVCSENKNYCTRLEIYLKNGIRKDTRYILDYRIEKAVTVYADVAELNWKLVPALDAVKKNVRLTVNLPENNFALAEKEEDEGIHYWGYGGVNSKFVKEECSNTKLVATSKKLGLNEEMEVLCYFPKQMTEVSSGSNVFSGTVGEPLILDRVHENLKTENHYAMLHNAVLYTGSIFGILFVAGMALAIVYIYRKFDKELVASFDGEFYRELPQNYPPAVMGYLYHEEAITEDDLNATLMDLIRRKFISVDANGSSLTEKNPNYKFIYDREKDRSELKEYETYLLNWYFDVIAGGRNELTLNEIDAFVKSEKNAKKYEECNRNWNQLAFKEGKNYNFFDRFAESGAKKYAGLSCLGLLIAILCFYGVISFSIDGLAVLAAVVLSLSFCFIIYINQIRRRTEQGNEDFVRWRAFEHFLREFSHFEDYPIPGIVVWEHYMVYATSFGIAELVEKQLRTKFSDLNRSDEFASSVMFYPSFSTYMRYRMVQSLTMGRQTIAVENAKRMSSSGHSGGHGGFGGGSSFGGGGGHSGVR